LQPPSSLVVVAGYWGTSVAGVTRPTVDSCDSRTGVSNVSLASAIEAGSAAAVAKLGGGLTAAPAEC